MVETRVLLVDDDRDDYLLTGELLREIHGGAYALEWVDDYEAGLERLRQHSHDVCLLDYSLGTKSGIDFLRELQLSGCTVPIILLTGNATGRLEADAIAAGATDYLIKGRTDAEALWRALRLATERNRVLEAMRERDRLFRAVFDGALDAMLIADDTGRYLDANPSACALTGRTRDELLRLGATDLLAGGSAPGATEDAWHAFLRAGRQSGEIQIRGADGERRTVEFAATANILPGRHLSVLRDVTKKRIEEETLARLAMIVESTDDIVVGIDLEDRITSWNASAARILGFAREEIVGRPYRSIVPDDLLTDHENLLAKLAHGEPVRQYETVRRHKDGRRIDVSLTLSVNRDYSGTIIGRSSIARDIREEKEIRMRLAISDRMASVGTLAAGVAHEINNPLAVTLANLSFGAETLASHPGVGDDPELMELKEVLSEATECAERVRNTVRDLKLFSRSDEEKLEPVDVSRIIESSLRMARNEIKHRARVVKNYSPTRTVDANEARLGQVFLNLLVNAAQALPDGGFEKNEIRVATFDRNGFVEVEITDTGSGIAPDELTRIFEPFFTTKPIGVGTGLGLSICHGIVRALGGEIRVRSEVGVGTTFSVILPAGRLEPQAPPSKTPVQSRSVRVLVIDDEAAIIRATKRLIASVHTVEGTTDPIEALDRILTGEEFDVVLCDVMMPRMTGAEFLTQVSRANPRMAQRIVFFTGGGFSSGAREFLESTTNLVLEKPFDSEMLLSAIAKVSEASLSSP